MKQATNYFLTRIISLSFRKRKDYLIVISGSYCLQDLSFTTIKMFLTGILHFWKKVECIVFSESITNRLFSCCQCSTEWWNIPCFSFGLFPWSCYGWQRIVMYVILLLDCSFIICYVRTSITQHLFQTTCIHWIMLSFRVRYPLDVCQSSAQYFSFLIQ